jgi:hypothetical protein
MTECLVHQTVRYSLHRCGDGYFLRRQRDGASAWLGAGQARAWTAFLGQLAERREYGPGQSYDASFDSRCGCYDAILSGAVFLDEGAEFPVLPVGGRFVAEILDEESEGSEA